MGSLRRYPIGYKPNICTTRAVMYYYKKIHEARVFLPKTNKYYIAPKEIEIDFLFVIINEQMECPTEKMYHKLNADCWKKYGPKKTNIKDYEVFVVILNVINNHGRVNYDFDEFKD